MNLSLNLNLRQFISYSYLLTVSYLKLDLEAKLYYFIPMKFTLSDKSKSLKKGIVFPISIIKRKSNIRAKGLVLKNPFLLINSIVFNERIGWC